MYKWLAAATFVLSSIGYSQQRSEVKVALFADAPYEVPDGYDMFRELHNQIHRMNPDFAIHLGDILGDTCSDERINRVKDLFLRFQVPLFYTPGDNEWTDCKKKGGFDPLERQTFVRKTFFDGRSYFGRQTFQVQNQSQVMPKHSRYRENLAWHRKGVQFATIHVVGSNNNFSRNKEEYQARNGAALDWLDKVFRDAVQDSRKAIVLFIHANPFNKKKLIEDDDDGKPAVVEKYRNGFLSLIGFLKQRVPALKVPVLLVHGDTHNFRFDNPLKVMTPYGFEYRYPHFYRAEVFGAPDVRGVELTIDTSREVPFVVTPMPHVEWTYPVEESEDVVDEGDSKRGR